MKTAERERARQLRLDEGLPINEIARRLRVAKSSVSLWVRDIELTGDQHAQLRALNPAYNGQRSGARTIAERYRAIRRRAQEHGLALARGGEQLHVLGCMLYWGGAESALRIRCVSRTQMRR